MKKKRYSEEQIAFALRQADSGVAVAEICRKMGVSEATFYRWKKKFHGMGVAELRRLRQLEEENRKLKQLVADLSLDKQMLQDVVKKSLCSKELSLTVKEDILRAYLPVYTLIALSQEARDEKSRSNDLARQAPLCRYRHASQTLAYLHPQCGWPGAV